LRKINPADVKADFAAGVRDIWAYYAAANARLTSDKHKTILAETTFLAVCVLWEGFLSDLVIAYINRDSSRFAQHLQVAVGEGRSAKQKTIFDLYGTVTIPVHISKADIIKIADENGNNITFSHYNDLITCAKRWLTDANSAGIRGVSARHRAVINAAISLRNHIAHRSDRSLKAMNDALEKGALHATGLKRGVNSVRHVGSYLKANAPGVGGSRIIAYVATLLVIANTL
jgi:extradiol dioxygenase family protein